jgi:hypothetical protein
MRRLLSWLFGIEDGKKSTRLHVSDVEIGEDIFIEWWKIENKIGEARCIGNDIETKKILVEISWTNGEKEKVILNYSGDELKNFHLLNVHRLDHQRDEKLNELLK